MANINRNNPTTHESGMVICDSLSKGSLIGESSYAFAGNKTGIALSQTVNLASEVNFNSPSLLNLGSVFPGQPVTLTVTATVTQKTSLVIVGYNGANNVSETINFPIGTNTFTSSNSYTSLGYVSCSSGGPLNNFTMGTNPLSVTTTLGVKQPQLAASLDINSSKGAILFPKATIAQIQAFDSSVNGVTYASTDGMRVYNTSTNSFCEKVNGTWSGLYLEEEFKPSPKTLFVRLNASALTQIGNNGSWQLLQPFSTYASNTTGLGSQVSTTSSSIVNVGANLKGQMPYPARVTANVSSGTVTGNFLAKVTGYYKGILFSEVIGAQNSLSSPYTTNAKFTSIISIVPTSGTGNFTVNYGYTAASPVYNIYSIAIDYFPSNVPNTGTGGLSLNYTSATDVGIPLLTNAELMASNATPLKVIVNLTNLICKDQLSVTNNGNTFGIPANNTQVSAFLTIKYDIIW